ncbi:MAG TPA: hypothetical protein VF481_05740, partial [Novosphingobium sp.]
MAEAAFRSEERIGLVVAIAAHIGLAALLLWHPNSKPVVVPPDRVEVTISDEVSLKSTAPQPAAQAAPDIAPDIGEPAPPEAEPSPLPEPPKPIVKPEPPKPAPKPLPPKPEPRPVPKPVPRPVPKPTMRPEPPRPVARPTARPAPRPSAAAARPATRPTTNPAPRQSVADAFKSNAPAGGTKVGADFLKGVQGATANGPARTPPAAAVGPAVRSGLVSAITRQLKPRWAAPQGAEADKLVTVLT